MSQQKLAHSHYWQNIGFYGDNFGRYIGNIQQKSAHSHYWLNKSFYGDNFGRYIGAQSENQK